MGRSKLAVLRGESAISPFLERDEDGIDEDQDDHEE
jgi:hypothetical protein